MKRKSHKSLLFDYINKSFELKNINLNKYEKNKKSKNIHRSRIDIIKENKKQMIKQIKSEGNTRRNSDI